MQGPYAALQFGGGGRVLSPELCRRFRKVSTGLRASAFRPRPRSSPAQEARPSLILKALLRGPRLGATKVDEATTGTEAGEIRRGVAIPPRSCRPRWAGSYRQVRSTPFGGSETNPPPRFAYTRVGDGSRGAGMCFSRARRSGHPPPAPGASVFSGPDDFPIDRTQRQP